MDFFGKMDQNYMEFTEVFKKNKSNKYVKDNSLNKNKIIADKMVVKVCVMYKMITPTYFHLIS